MKLAECRSCGAPIVWATTEKGKKMPVDTEPVSDGKFILEEEDDDSARKALFIGDRDPYSGPRYSSHFSTCPNADQHRATPGKRDPRSGATALQSPGCRPGKDGLCLTHPPCEDTRILIDALRRAAGR